MDRLDDLETFGRQCFGQILFADAIDAMSSKFLTPLIDKVIPCEDAMDTNDDGILDISDPIFSLAYMFLGGPEPALPGVECGTDPTKDTLGCEDYLPCAELEGEFLSASLQPSDGCEDILEQLREKIIDNDGLHGRAVETVDLALQVGFYPIRVDFFQRHGGVACELWWEGPEIPLQPVPPGAFSHLP